MWNSSKLPRGHNYQSVSLQQGPVSFPPCAFYTQKILCAARSVLSEYQEFCTNASLLSRHTASLLCPPTDFVALQHILACDILGQLF